MEEDFIGLGEQGGYFKGEKVFVEGKLHTKVEIPGWRRYGCREGSRE